MGVQGSGMKIGNRNSIGHGVKAKNRVRVTDVVTAGSGPRAVGMMRAERTASMRHENPESGRPSIKRRDPASPPAAPHNWMGGAPSSRHPQVNVRSSSN